MLALWGAEVPGKTKVHCWRVLSNGLVVGSELQRRKIKPGALCIACNGDETMLHRFWQCPHAIRTWEVLREKTGYRLVSPPSDVHDHGGIKRWLLDKFGEMDSEELNLLLMALYQIWQARNGARDTSQIENLNQTARCAFYLLEEWKALSVARADRSPSQVEHWHPPEQGWVKVNADGAFSSDNGCGGGGVVMRDHHGSFVAGACHFFPSVADPEQAGLLACHRSLGLAKEMHKDRVVLESDCLNVVMKLQCTEKDLSANGPLVDEIKELLHEFDGVSIVHVRRSCNEVAHSFAKLCKTWVDVPPGYVVNLLVADCAGS